MGREGNGLGRADAKRQEREAQLREKVKPSRQAKFAWDLALQWLADHLPESTLNLWLAPLTCLGEADGRLILSAPSRVASWSERRYGKFAGDAVREVSHFTGAFICRESPQPEEEWL